MRKHVKVESTEDAARFMYAGNALFTLVSKRTGARFTYKIRKADDNSPLRFVRVLSGPDNENDYSYIGYINDNDKGKLMAGKKGRPNAPSFVALNWALKHLCADSAHDELEFYHAGKCGACGRTLTVPESIETGMGPICRGRFE